MIDKWEVMFDHDDFGESFDSMENEFDDSGEFEDVEALRETPKALLVKLATGAERWLPKKALRPASEVQVMGDRGVLSIHGWFQKTWDLEDIQEKKAKVPFKVPGFSIVMRQTAKALLVKLADGREMWFPMGHIDAASECLYDGDSGTLIVSAWIASEKGIKAT